MTDFINNVLKFFFIMTPFFVLSMFLVYTAGWEEKSKRLLALRIGFAVFIISMVLFVFGRWIFNIFGITLDAFRIGGGGLLFLSAVGLVNSKVEDKKTQKDEVSAEEKVSSIAVVPLAIPSTVGPGTTAALILFGAEASSGKLQKYFTGAAALFLATLMLTCILFVATGIERRMGKRVIMILSKITGLVLAALASQLIFDGVGSILAKYLK